MVLRNSLLSLQVVNVDYLNLFTVTLPDHWRLLKPSTDTIHTTHSEIHFTNDNTQYNYYSELQHFTSDHKLKECWVFKTSHTHTAN